MATLFQVDSISVLHEMFNYEKPKNSLISVIDLNKIKPDPSHLNEQLIMGFYTISLKNGMDCAVKYGHQTYDFNEGSMMFMAPGQVTVAQYSQLDRTAKENWMLCFHPDLIRKSKLARDIHEYHFFEYSVSEALHLSDAEKNTVTAIVRSIEAEYSQNLDSYSYDLILSHLELLLNYCNRFYGRQFLTRHAVNQDVVSQFEVMLKKQIDLANLEESGIPRVKELADTLCYSPSYLSDLLKKETGKTIQEHIQLHLVEKAKTLLRSTTKPISEISYSLGFDYPTHFSKFFKTHTGMSPKAYRQ